ncbi:hypothetical protein [Paenarthrobacter sp. C1]|uniref:hypothetical protein n=1 Tax=Paenarthrobacter sp. C1 TaxID=3400220 RepID=UPI003BF48FA3
MGNRLVSVGDDFNLPDEVNVIDENLPTRLQPGELNATIGDQVEPVSVKVNNRPKVADGIFAAEDEALRAGRSACRQWQIDSTGNATYEPPYLLTLRQAAKHPTAHVKYKLWDHATQGYGAWNTVQAGAAGERHAVFSGANITRTFYTPQAAIPHIAGDFDVRARLSMNDWTPGAVSGIVSRYGAAGSRGWKLSIGATGLIDFTWTTDGTTNIQKVSSAAAGFADGTEGWIRATLDVDNGLGGYTWKAYKSTDGVTWTEIGSSEVTTGGATSIFDAPQEYEIGGRGFNAEAWAGKLYEVQIRDGINGKIVNPQPIDSWIPRGVSGSYVAGTFGGSATLYVLNGSNPGSDYAYFSDPARHPKMVHPYAGSLLMQACSHNDGSNTGVAYLASREAWLALNDSRAPGSQTVLITQNPELPGGTVGLDNINNHARRRPLLMAWGSRRGLVVIDTYKAFLDDPRGVDALLESDKLHPNVEGSLVAADAIEGVNLAAL